MNASHAKAEAAQGEAAAPLVEAPPGPARGLLVALHGADQTAAHAFAQWRAAVDAGFVLMAVESTQRNTPAYRSWTDPLVGDRDVSRAYAGLPAAYRALPLVVGGFSAGARQALRWALSGVPERPGGFVAVAPASDPEQLPDPGSAAAAGCTGAILLGDRDDDVADAATATYSFLRDAGVHVRLELVPGLGHAYPDDFGDRLRKALETGSLIAHG